MLPSLTVAVRQFLHKKTILNLKQILNIYFQQYFLSEKNAIGGFSILTFQMESLLTHNTKNEAFH